MLCTSAGRCTSPLAEPTRSSDRWTSADVIPVGRFLFMDRTAKAASIRASFSGGSIITPIDGATPVLTEAEVERLAALDEQEFVREMTPYLHRVLIGPPEVWESDDPFAPQLFNSELLPWLWDPALRDTPHVKKPDLFEAPEVFVTGQSRSQLSAQGRGFGYRFGQVPRRLHLDGCVWKLLEAKRGKGLLSHEDFGDAVEYGTYVLGVCVVLLFNALEFILYRAENGEPREMQRGQWTTPGAAEAIRRFFAYPRSEPPLQALLRTVLATLGCRISFSGDIEAGRTSFLGAGGSGRVFRVVERSSADAAVSAGSGGAASAGSGGAASAGSAGSGGVASEEAAGSSSSISAVGGASTTDPALRRRSAPVLALKVVLAGEEARQLLVQSEYLRQMQAANDGAPVVAPVEGSFQRVVHLGAAYLLSSVGAPIKLSQATCLSAFQALKALHCAGWCHGDARVANLVADSGGALRWIDMAFAERYTTKGASTDAWALATSIAECATDDLPVKELLAAFSRDFSEAQLGSLASQLWTFRAANRKLRNAASTSSLSGSPRPSP